MGGASVKWQFSNDAPIYSQLIAQIKVGIVSGAFPPGERLPSVRDLATEAGVNPNTMQRALTELERTDIAIVTGDLDYAIAMQMAQGGMVKMISAQCPYEQGEAIAMVAANGLLGKAVPSFIGVEPISIDRENLLKNWKAIFKEDPPAALRNAINRSAGAL